MLSPKNHIRGKCMRDATDAQTISRYNQAKKAGVKPAFSVWVG
jgi:hypothetical protein